MFVSIWRDTHSRCLLFCFPSCCKRKLFLDKNCSLETTGYCPLCGTSAQGHVWLCNWSPGSMWWPNYRSPEAIRRIYAIILLKHQRAWLESDLWWPLQYLLIYKGDHDSKWSQTEKWSKWMTHGSEFSSLSKHLLQLPWMMCFLVGCHGIGLCRSFDLRSL